MVTSPDPLVYIVSIIIPCYNHGRYLARAIESSLAQDYLNYEIIVVDDGSIDNTREVAQNYNSVKYVYQHNQGLSSARNTGIDHSIGTFLVFLDADDWLFAEALSTNIRYLEARPDAGFVSGAFTDVLMSYGYQVKNCIYKNHYSHLLKKNYIAMHATVMYRRWAFATVRFDTFLKACEDYDIYLKIARKHPVICHTKQIAVYNRHETNMSGDYPMMLKYTLLVLNRQKEILQNETEEKFFRYGLQYWKDHYCINIYADLSRDINTDTDKRKAQLDTLKQYHKDLYYKYLLMKPLMPIKKILIRGSFNNTLKTLYKVGLNKTFVPAPGSLKMDNINRLNPFSKNFGYERGGSIDRYYIESFLEKHALLIKGRVLEIGDNEYTLRFGKSRVIQSDILHVNVDNKRATFIGDLSDAPSLPSDTFDCIVLAQSLQFIFDYRAALESCYRILRPGGSLLLTVPGISPVCQSGWETKSIYSFTDSAITKMLSEIFSVENVEVETFGNVLVAAAFLFGIGFPELKKQQIDYNDPHYQLIVAASAVKRQF